MSQEYLKPASSFFNHKQPQMFIMIITERIGKKLRGIVQEKKHISFACMNLEAVPVKFYVRLGK